MEQEDEVTGEMVKPCGELVVHWIWKHCDITMDNVVLLENWRSGVTVLL